MRTVARILARTFVLAAALALLGGCGAWTTTKRYYKEYVNPNPAIDITYQGLSDEEEKVLALTFGPADMRLEALLRDLDSVDVYPENRSWFEKFRARHAFLDGVMAIDLDGRVLKGSPETPLKPFDPAPILALTEEAQKRLTVSSIVQTDLGPEIHLAQPFFKENRVVGFVVASFDPRSMVMDAQGAARLNILGYEGLLRAADDAEPDPALVRAPWRDIVKTRTQGTVTAGGKRYVWLARQLAGQHLIYAVEAPAGKGGIWPW